MNMEVRNALTDFIVHCHECPLRLHGRLDGGAKQLHGSEERAIFRRRKIGQCLDMLFGNQEHVAWKQRTVIEERHCILVFEYDRCLGTSMSNFTKDATHPKFRRYH